MEVLKLMRTRFSFCGESCFFQGTWFYMNETRWKSWTLQLNLKLFSQAVGSFVLCGFPLQLHFLFVHWEETTAETSFFHKSDHRIKTHKWLSRFGVNCKLTTKSNVRENWTKLAETTCVFEHRQRIIRSIAFAEISSVTMESQSCSLGKVKTTCDFMNLRVIRTSDRV